MACPLHSRGPMRATWLPVLALLGLAGPALAGAERGRTPLTAPSRTITRVTRPVLAARFPGRTARDLRGLARQRQWKPSEAWLAADRARYGVLLAVSDLHAGPGLDPLTGKLNNAEDFKSPQEQLLHRM